MGKKPAPTTLAAALATLDADDLRDLIRELVSTLDEEAAARVLDHVTSRAARKGKGWLPAKIDDDEVAEIASFAKSAERVHMAEPSAVERFLRRGVDAFLRRDYTIARKIYAVLLPPLAEGEIDLGQDEMLDEVLTLDIGVCATQYVVAVYMTTEDVRRADAVLEALRTVGDLGMFWEPLKEMESTAVEPIPGLDAFLPNWRALLEREATARARPDSVGSDEDRWLREVALRLEGTEGLAKRARATRSFDDLHAWCEVLVADRDWKAALAAFEEAAALVGDAKYHIAEFLDGAALAAQELGRADLPGRFERAWRAMPHMMRLRRWLGTQRTAAGVRKLATVALEACPPDDKCQIAFLHVALGDFESAAGLLAKAPGLGWSGREHPGHLLFPLFIGLLRDGTLDALDAYSWAEIPGLRTDMMEFEPPDPDAPRLATPSVAGILAAAGLKGPLGNRAREAMLEAVQQAAKKRVEGVTKEKRRGHYRHAARLIAECASLGENGSGERWVDALRARYSRLPALQREIDEALSNAKSRDADRRPRAGRA